MPLFISRLAALIHVLALAIVGILALTAGAFAGSLAPGEPLTAGHAAELLDPYFPALDVGVERELRFVQPAFPLPNPAQSPATLRVLGLDRGANGQFFARLHVRLSGGEEATLHLAGRAVELVEAPVTAAALRAGTPLEGGMTLAWVERDRLPGDAILDLGEIEGLEARRRLAAGRVVRMRDARPEALIRRGETVTLGYASGALVLETSARALEDGAMGEIVRLSNLDTDRTVRGRVVGRKRAAVGPGN